MLENICRKTGNVVFIEQSEKQVTLQKDNI